MSTPSIFSLAGKTALIAGASRGIGLAIAKEMAAAGAHTILAARSVDKLKAEAKALKKAGYSVAVQELDVANDESIAACVKKLGPKVDILVNVSGTNVRKRVEDYTKEEYDRIMQTNLHGIVMLTKGIGVHMKKRGRGGKVVNIGSLMSILGLPYLAVYAMTKSALYGLTRVLAAEWGRDNIQVNCIAPGFIITDLNRKMWEPKVMTDWLEGVQANPRPGTPEDCAGLAVLLSSGAANYISGQCIAVDGGYSTTRIWPFEPVS
ncbi:MAG: SDR family oxidoreductase [Acidobacteria bacterium]|nr:SDR family oxidoreductase [Acidobacteriota bacterium]